MAVASAAADKAPHPVAFYVEYQERHSRWKTLFRLFLAIPQLIVIYLLMTAVYCITVIAWFAILFTKRYPQGLFDFSLGALRWTANVGVYNALMRDEYPPFSWQPGEYPVTLAIERPEQQSRWRLFVRAFAIAPNIIVFYFVQLAWFVTLVVVWFWILATGRYPRWAFTFGVGTLRWYMRQIAYMLLLRDEYPPYRLRADAPPGNEVISAVIGLPIFVAYVAVYVFFLTRSRPSPVGPTPWSCSRSRQAHCGRRPRPAPPAACA